MFFLALAAFAAPGPAQAAAGGCIKTGCSGQICSDQDVVSTCEYRPEYACYQSAQCARQADGRCGWTQTTALTACLTGAGAASPTLTSLSPNQGATGTSVTLRGSGFSTAEAGNTIQFGTHRITGARSVSGTTLVFQVPTVMNVVCIQAPCNPVPVSAGDYPVSVISGDKTSNSVTFTVTGGSASPTPCPLYQSNGATVPDGFAVPWNLWASGNLLLSATCSGTGTTVTAGVGGNTSIYVWHQAYTTRDGTAWEAPRELSGTKTQDGNWIIGAATLSLATKPQYVAAYICQFQSNAWQCGCRTQGDCGKWNLQGVR